MKRPFTVAASLTALVFLAVSAGVASPAIAADAASTESLLDYSVLHAAPTLVAGGLRFDETAAGGAAVDAFHTEHTSLASITSLSYDVAVAPDDGQADPAYVLDVNTNGGGDPAVLSAEPAQNGQATNASGEFDVTGWAFSSGSLGASADGGQQNPEPLSWFQSQYPNAVITGHGVQLAGAAAGSVAVVSSTSFNGAVTDFTLGSQANPVPTQAAPVGSSEVGPATVTGIDSYTGFGTQHDSYTAGGPFGAVYYDVQTANVKDPAAVTGLTAPVVVQPQGSYSGADKGELVWETTIQGTVTLSPVDGATWTIDRVGVSGGVVITVGDGDHLIKLTPDAGRKVYSADIPASGKPQPNGVVYFHADTLPGAGGGSADVSVSRPPTVSGTSEVGKSLTVNMTGAISPSGATASYQWFLENPATILDDPHHDDPILGATGSTFTPTSAGYVGKRLTVMVTFHYPDYTSYTRWVFPDDGGLVKVGTLTSAVPGISGTPKVGNRLTAGPGAWTSGTTFAYQWYANGRAIAGEHFANVTLRPAQLGQQIGLRITGTKSGYTTVVRTSHATAAVGTGAIVGAVPTIGMTRTAGGAPLVGATLNAHLGSWTAGASFRYQWYRDGAPITGATSSAYTIPASGPGHTFHVAVKGVEVDCAPLTKISAATLKALPATTGMLTSAVPGISGTPKVGNRLTAVSGKWTPGTSFAYQWYANGRAIAGEHNPVLVLLPVQYGTRIGLRITGTKSGYTTLVRTSHATAAVGTGAIVGAIPTISMTTSAGGAPLVGATLNVHIRSWTAGTSFRYQWYRDASPISGATSSAYEIPAGGLGHTFHIAIKGTQAAYTALTKVSVTTAKTLEPRAYYEARSGNKTTFKIIVSGLVPSADWDGNPGTVGILYWQPPDYSPHSLEEVTGVTPYTTEITLKDVPWYRCNLSLMAVGGFVNYPFAFAHATVVLDEKPAGAPDAYYSRYMAQTEADEGAPLSVEVCG